MALGVPNIATAGVRIAPDFTGFGRDVQRGVQTGLAGVSQKALGAGQALAPLSIALGGVAAASGKMALDFGKSMTQIETLVGVSRDQVDAWADDITGLAGEVGRAPVELADALYFVTSAGIDASEALGVVEVAGKAAALGLGETSTIADAVTSAMNAYGSETLPAARATEILTAAVREGKLEAGALAPVLGRLLPTASALNIGFEDVAGTLAVMSRTGLDAAEASTSVGAIMSALLKPGAQAQRTLESVGLSMGDLRDVVGRPGGLVEVMRILDETLGDDDEALAQVIPNVRAFRGVMNVLAQDAGIVDDVMGGVADSVGLVDEAFAKLEADPAFQLEQSIASLKGAAVELGATFGPAIKVVASGIKLVADGFGALSPVSKTLIGISVAAGAVAAPLLLMVGGVTRAIGSLRGLSGAHLQAASAARVHAASEGVLAATLGRTAAVAGTRTVAGLGTFTLGGAAAAKGAGGLLGKIGPRLLKGVGIGLAADLAGGLVDALPTEENTIGNAVKKTTSNALRGAGIGAAVGSIIPGIGTAIGAAGGALIGGAIGFFNNRSDDLNAAAANLIEPDHLRQRGVNAGQALGEGVETGAEQSLLHLNQRFRDVLPDPAGIFQPFKDQFAEISSVGIAEIEAMTSHNLEHITELEGGFKRLETAGLLGLRDSLAQLAQSDPGAALGTLRDVLSEISEGDFTQLIDIETNLRLGDGTLPAIDSVVEQFRGLLTERMENVFATPGVTRLGGDFLSALFPSDAEIAAASELLGGAIPAGLKSGIDAGSGEAINAGAVLIFGTIEAARAAAEASSPSRAFIRLGHDMTDGLTIGLQAGFSEVSRLVASQLAALNRQISTGVTALAGVNVRGGDGTAAGSKNTTIVVNNPTTTNLTTDTQRALALARLDQAL